MHTPAALLDIHERTHQCLAALLGHCRSLDQEELHRELPGFGYPSVQLQFHHEIAAQKYWTGVLEGRIDVDDDPVACATVSLLEAYRVRVYALTEQFLRGVTAEELNAVRPMMTWGNREQMLSPAQVILRTQTHLFHHQGQILAMCRLLGKPCNGFDYPIDLR